MNFGDIFKIDSWWKLVLMCGILVSAAAFIFDIQFIDRRFALGLGIGMILIGIGYWMAKRRAHTWADGGMYSWTVYEHGWTSKLLIGFGVITTIYFLSRILFLLAI